MVFKTKAKSGQQAQATASPDEAALVARLRAGDRDAFEELVSSYHGSLLRVAMSFVAERSAAEEVVQDTWFGVILGISGFEGRSSLKTWIFRILANRAQTRGKRGANGKRVRFRFLR